MLNLATAEADITPEEDIDLSGFVLRKNPGAGIHDRIKIRWLSLCDDNCRCALVGAADVLSLSRSMFQGLRDELLSVLPDYGYVGLATTHTHSAPAVVPLRHCGRINRAYISQMRSAAVASAVAATKKQKPVSRIRIASVDVDVCLNRRQGESGPADRELLVVAFDDARGKPAAVVVNYACHPVALGHENRGVSADYPGYLCRAVEEETGGTCLFLNGACGDINPRDAHHNTTLAAQKMGIKLAESAIDALKNAVVVSSSSLGWHRQIVRIPVHVPASLAEVHARLDDLEKRFGVPRELFSGRIKRDQRLLETGRYPRQITIELSLLTIGDEVGILFVPGELFTSIGLRAKQMASPRKLLISGFSNGSVGYLSDRQGFAEGGYEPLFANFFYDYPEFDPSLEDHLLEGIQRLLNAAVR